MVLKHYCLYSLVVVFGPTVQSFHFQKTISCLGNCNNQSYKLLFPSPSSTSISSSTSGHARNYHFESSNDGISRLYSERRGKNTNSNGKTKKIIGKTKNKNADRDVSRFLADFRTADGSVVHPYELLQVSRSATTAEIKRSYRRLSRKLHPDMVARMEILPGRCTNLDDVREEWEKVKFSYEILSDARRRKNYDRNSSVAEVLNDPGAAVGRAVVGGAVGGLGLVLGGAWKLGEMAARTIHDAAAVAATAVAEAERNEVEGASSRSKKMSASDELGVGDFDLGTSTDGIGEGVVDGNTMDASKPQLVSTNQASVIDAGMLSKSGRDFSSISVVSSEELSSAVATASGRDLNAINILTVNNADATASSATEQRIRRRGTKGFGK